jgi:hypothetical protein
MALDRGSSALARIDPVLLTKIGPPTFRPDRQERGFFGTARGKALTCALACRLGRESEIRCARLSEA